MTYLPRHGLVQKLSVDRELLSRCRTRKEREHQREVIEIRDKAFHAHQRDVSLGDACDHAGVAFVGDNAHAARLCHAEVDSAQADVGGEEDFAQNFSRGCGQCGDVFGVGNADLFMKELRHLLPGEMRRRCDDVTRSLVPKLHDVLAEVGLDHIDAFIFQRMVEFDFFRDHAFGFGNQGLTFYGFRIT